jgi:hypothetical protein
VDKTKLAVILALVGALALIMPFVLDWRAGVAFERIKQGDHEALVLGYLSSPSQMGACPDRLMWNGQDIGANDGRCVRWYTWTYARHAYSIGFSQEKKVVAKKRGE